MDHNGDWVLQISYGKGRISNSCSLRYNLSFQQGMKEMRKRVCGINPCQLDLISYCSLFCIEHLWMDGLFLQHSCTLPFSTLLFSLPDCFSLPPPLWKHTSFLSVAMRMILEGLVRRNAWIQGRWENKSAYNSFNQAADGCVMPEPGVLCICMRYTFPPEMEEGKAVMAAYPVCRFSISVFAT